MNISEKSMTTPIITASLKNSISYVSYRDLVTRLVEENSTTGNEKTEDLANYTMLNNKRMKRWDKTIKISETDKQIIGAFDKKIIWLIITESWCGDAAHIMPVIDKVAELNPNIDYKIVLRDDNEALMNAFLTNGGKSIPKLIMINAITSEVVNTFGPRPAAATKMVADYKTKHGAITTEFKEDLQHWYNTNKGQAIVADLLELLK
jgi:thiol-disulfide isomerase/thioredoxin